MASKTNAARVTNHEHGHNIELIQKYDNNPLPPIESLERLHKFRPDLIDKTIALLEEEASFRRQQEEKMLKFSQRDNLLSQIFAFIICLSGIAGAIYVGIQGNELASFGVLGIPIAIVVTAFLRRRK
ncbi:Predicted membrane protein [Anaerobiospirillum thomasii]|uniref:hypothetical protein n=1 Tax=Anaerobiospirillum thomasii TaxID=179995 RepID=UPI000D83816F|nr:hypothetical protein [Anaerobiospirillum thomasii]SPT71060.1 Predicted membrane protein [Anaerobiospirillum thomasii]